jgi:hypothetical protein
MISLDCPDTENFSQLLPIPNCQSSARPSRREHENLQTFARPVNGRDAFFGELFVLAALHPSSD